MNLEVILEAKYIPDKSIVKKISGTSEYTLLDTISIDSYDNDKRQFIKSDGCKFLLSESGSIYCIPEDKKLLFVTNLCELNYLFGEDDD